jgi:hypothetical protein
MVEAQWDEKSPGASDWRQTTHVVMKLLILFLIWCGLFLLSWPVALLALVVFPVVWLLCLPFRLLGIAVGAVFAFLKALLYLPARILGYRPNRT